MKPRITKKTLAGIDNILKLIPVTDVVNNDETRSAVKYLSSVVEYRKSEEFLRKRGQLRAKFEVQR